MNIGLLQQNVHQIVSLNAAYNLGHHSEVISLKLFEDEITVLCCPSETSFAPNKQLNLHLLFKIVKKRLQCRRGKNITIFNFKKSELIQTFVSIMSQW